MFTPNQENQIDFLALCCQAWNNLIAEGVV